MTEQILGIPFFHGSTAEAVVQATQSGGLVVAPSGTCFERFLEDDEYRRAILTADLVLPDSGAMVALWRLLRRRSLHRISGLAYLKQLLGEVDLRDVLWVLPHERAREKLLAWITHSAEIPPSGVGPSPSASGVPRFSTPPSPNFDLPSSNSFYLAPIYGPKVKDEALLALIVQRQPRHVIIAIGAGAQEKLGLYLRENLPYPASALPHSAFRDPPSVFPDLPTSAFRDPPSAFTDLPSPGPELALSPSDFRASHSEPRLPPSALRTSRSDFRASRSESSPPAIHCIGGALGFVTGDQTTIPDWADRLYLGWFLRFLSQPRAFLPRLWKARLLPTLILRYGASLPPLRTPKT